MDRFETARTPWALSGGAAAERVTAFLRVVYGWMFAGLAVTAAVAWIVAGSPTLIRAIVANRALFWVIAIAQGRPASTTIGSL